jgi:hypothetical protein
MPVAYYAFCHTKSTFPATRKKASMAGLKPHSANRALTSVKWTPDFGRPDKVEPPGLAVPYQEDDDAGQATCVPSPVQGQGSPGGREGRPDDGPTSEPVRHPYEPDNGLEEAVDALCANDR